MAAPSRSLSLTATPVASSPATDTVEATVARRRLIEDDELVLVGFSGGADSTACLVVLKQLGYRVAAVHVDHGMRPDSGRDALHCREVARRLKVEFSSQVVVVRPSTEQAAREARYAALKEAAEGMGADKIATGHTLDDQAETVKMRLERGGFGLGIPYRRGRIIRPLLDCRREQTEQICRSEGIDFLIDPSNADLRFTRNRIRLELRRAGPEAITRLVQIGNLSRIEVEGQEAAARDLMDRAVQWERGLVRIDRGVLKIIDHGAAAALVREVVSRLAGQAEPDSAPDGAGAAFSRAGADLGSAVIRDILAKVAPVTGASLDLPGGLRVWSEPAHVVLGCRESGPRFGVIALDGAGTTYVPAWGLEIEVDRRLVRPASLNTGPMEAYFDPAEIDKPLALRQWRPGDRFKPLGSSGTKKLQDFFVDSKVPRRERALVPLVCWGERILWVTGHRIDDRFKVGPGAKQVMRIRIAPRP